ncbi:MAG TPA: dihydrofolate reductase family protein [Streptosporangiaceae bacterium]|nr:dihydrofolate reductase family protein [Streptosporangiaceae bacterium]
MNEIGKYVVSRTLTQDDLSWGNTTLLPAHYLIGAVQRLREKDGGDLQVMGSLSLARWLTGNDLVDEYRLMIEPVILGGGKRLFPDDRRAHTLELVTTTTSNTGVHICTYRPVRQTAS